MSSDVCKHCTHAACLDVCPTGSLFRTEFGTVVVQDDICNGCGYCVAGLPVRRDRPPRRRDAEGAAKNVGIAQKCTLCYDRLGDGQTPACAQACPTQSIQFGDVDELRERRRARVEELHDGGRHGRAAVRRDPDDGVGGAGAIFLLLDEPEVYGFPPDPVVTTRDLPRDVQARPACAAAWRCSAGRRGLVRREAPVSRPRPPFDARPAGRSVARRRRRRRRSAARAAGRRAAGATSARWCPTATFTSYYGRPVVKASPWEADIPAYLFVGGLAAGSSLLGAGADLTGRPALRRTGRHRRDRRARLSMVRAGPRPRQAEPVPQHAARGQADLADVGRHLDPHRVRPASPGRRAAEVGRLLLGALPAPVGRAAARCSAGLGPSGRPRARPASRPPVASYTAVLLADTATPAWHEAYRELPFVFVGSAAAASGLALVMVAAPSPRPGRRAGSPSAARSPSWSMEHRMEQSSGPAAEPLHNGKAGRLMQGEQGADRRPARPAPLLGGRSRVGAALSRRGADGRVGLHPFRGLRGRAGLGRGPEVHRRPAARAARTRAAPSVVPTRSRRRTSRLRHDDDRTT